MIVYFAGRNLDILGMAATGLPDGLRIVDDLKTEDIDSGVASLELTVCFPGQNPQVMEQMCDVGNYLLCSCQGENEFYTVIDYERDSKAQTIRLYAEDAGLDLLNEIAPPFAADAAHDIGWYVDTFAKDSGFELGINEIPTLTRKLAWEGEQTVTERLRSVATQFDNCELSYSFTAKGMEVTHKYINIYARRGKDMEETLRLNLELDRIVTKKSAANLATALLVTGGIPEGAEDPVTLEGYEYDDGDLYTDGAYLKSRSAVEKWGRYIQDESGGASDRHIVQTYTYDTTSQQTLCAHAVTELKQRSEVETNYEVDIRVLPENVRIGDRINIVDDHAALYLSARVLKLERSACLDKRTATLGEYLIRDSGISERVYELAQSYKKAVQGTAAAQAAANTAKGDASEAKANAAQAQADADRANVMIKNLSADFADIERLVAEKADIGALNAATAQIGSLTADLAQVEQLIAQKAEVDDLEAANAHITDLSADLAQVEELVAGKADIDDLNAANASIGSLTADLANVETLLAGSAGVGNLQAIHLTGDNVVIDDALITDAMIANLSAGKLTAGTLYTSLVKIVSDQEEHLVIDGATLQLKDAAGTIRVQIGKDASGDYSYYLWDAQGNLMWSPTGVTADGLNDGIIRDVNVAEDAAISGDKLNISSVAQKLNEDGSLTVDAGQVTIDGEKLDVAYKQVTQDLQGTQEALDGLQVGGRNLLHNTKTMAGYSKSDNVTTALDEDGFTLARFAPVDAPGWNSVNTRPAISFSSLRNQTATFSLLVRSEDWAELNGDNSHGLLIAFCLCSGDSLARTLYATQGYYTTPLSPAWTKVTTTVELTDSFFNRGSGTIDESTRFYVQVYNYSIYSMEVKEFKLELGNLATDWTPAPEDGEEALSEVTQRTTALETGLSVVQGQITSKVWESDITQITNPLGQQLTTLEDQYSQMSQTVDGITLSVGNLQTTTEALGSSISDVQGELALKVGRDDNDQIVSMLNASADQINLTGQRIKIDSPNFKLAADGTVTAVNADLSGKVTATSGSIGNWVINQAGIIATREYDGLQYRYVIQAPSTDLGSWYSFLACQYRASSDDPWSYAFQVGYDGDISGRGLALSEDLEVAGGATVGGNLTASYMKSTGYLDAADRIRCSAGSISIGSGSGVLLLPSGDAYLQGSGNLKADGNGAFAGSLSTYGYLVPRMQHGSVSVTVTANTWKTVSVTFPKAFPGTPDVTVTPRHNSQETNISYKLTALSASGFTLGLYCSGGGTYAVHWTAMYG